MQMPAPCATTTSAAFSRIKGHGNTLYCIRALLCFLPTAFTGCSSAVMAEFVPAWSPIGSAAWYSADEDMTHFYSVIAHPEYRDEFLEQYEQSDNKEDREYAAGFRASCRQADAAAEVFAQMSPREKTDFALAYVKEYTASLQKHHIATTEDFEDNNRYLRIGNWDGMFTRALASLSPEQQALLNTPGGESMMSAYGGYMVARYVAYNPDVPAEIRRQALFIVSLWQVCSDGEHGYRSNWLREPKA